MSIPSAAEIAEFFKESDSNDGEANRFWNFYQSKGWLVGKTPMRDWKAASRNWIGRSAEERAGRGAGMQGRHSESGADASAGSYLAALSARNEDRLNAMRAQGLLRPREH